MKLIIHAGTHKTATTSIQHFCAMNRDVLRACGFFYPHNPHSAYVFNFLASQIAFGKAAQTGLFLDRARKAAQAAGCHTVVISAESFYAMTAFFIDVQGHKRPLPDYAECEKKFISDLKKVCAGYDDTEIVFYMRSQDDLAASLYNQFVKNIVGIDGAYEDFIETIRPVFDYESHIGLWEDVFGRDRVRVSNFMACGDDVVRDFCTRFLNEECFSRAGKSDFRSNEKLSRDVLEAKRFFNAARPDRAIGFVAARCFRALSNDFTDRPGDQVFAPLSFRRQWFGSFATGNDRLSARYGLGRFPVIAKDAECSYPGLSAERRSEIETRFADIMNRPVNRIEIALRRIARRIMESGAIGRILLSPVRRAHNFLRLNLAGW